MMIFLSVAAFVLSVFGMFFAESMNGWEWHAVEFLCFFATIFSMFSVGILVFLDITE
jgi:hypothetical protein